MTSKVDLARRTLRACDDFRQAVLDADRIVARENNKATPATWSAFTSVIRKAGALDDLSEQLARSVLDE